MTDLILHQDKLTALSKDSLPEELERLLEDQRIDWSGNLLGKSYNYTSSVPVINKKSKLYPLLFSAVRQIEHSLKPASPKEILMHLAKLRLHFGFSVMNEDETALLLEDYLSDLSSYPIDLIEKVCVDYRRDGKNLFFPKVGQLISQLDKSWYPRLYKLKKLKKILELSDQHQQKEQQ